MIEFKIYPSKVDFSVDGLSNDATNKEEIEAIIESIESDGVVLSVDTYRSEPNVIFCFERITSEGLIPIVTAELSTNDLKSLVNHLNHFLQQ